MARNETGGRSRPLPAAIVALGGLVAARLALRAPFLAALAGAAALASARSGQNGGGRRAGPTLTAADVMTPNPVVIGPEASLAEAARLMRDADIGWLPVAEGDRLIGAVTDRDLVVRGLAETAGEGRVRAAMTNEILWCFEDEPIEAVLEDMADSSVARLPVLSREKRLVGAVTLADVALADPERAAAFRSRSAGSPPPVGRRESDAPSSPSAEMTEA